MISQTIIVFSSAMYWERAQEGNEKRPYKKLLRNLSERIITICSDTVPFLDGGEIHEMRWAVNLVIKLLWIGQVKFILHVRVVANTHEVVVPRSLTRDHEKAKELIR